MRLSLQREPGVLVASSGMSVGVYGRFWLLRWRWRRALKRGTFMRLVCSDGKPRWFNARQIAVMAELPLTDYRAANSHPEAEQ